MLRPRDTTRVSGELAQDLVRCRKGRCLGRHHSVSISVARRRFRVPCDPKYADVGTKRVLLRYRRLRYSACCIVDRLTDTHAE